MRRKLRVLIAGSTGYLGRHVVAAAVRRGHSVAAIARTASKLEDFRSEIDVIEAQVTDVGSLRGVCDGVDVVFSSLGITRQTDKVTYEDVDYQANLNLLREAERAGVRRFVFVSVLHPEYTLHTDMVRAKERFVETLRASPIESVVVRPTGFFSDMGEFQDMARRGRCWVFGDGTAKLNPIHGADLAEVCVDALVGDESEVQVGGPDILTQREIAALAFQGLGKPARVSGLPLWLVDALLWLIKPFHRRWWNIGSFMSGAGRHDMVGPAHGEHHLADWFAERARAT